MNGVVQPVRAGDFVAKPAGRGIAHRFTNTGSGMLAILDIGTVETGDICHYPEEDIYYLRDDKLSFRRADALSGWTSDPNG